MAVIGTFSLFIVLQAKYSVKYLSHFRSVSERTLKVRNLYAQAN